MFVDEYNGRRLAVSRNPFGKSFLSIMSFTLLITLTKVRIYHIYIFILLLSVYYMVVTFHYRNPYENIKFILPNIYIFLQSK